MEPSTTPQSPQASATPHAAPHQRLEEAIAARAEARRLRNARERLEESLIAARAVVDERQGALEQEQGDVDKLSTPSFARTLASLRGTITDRIARERAEADQARYALGEAQMRLTQLMREAEALEGALADLGPTDQAYEQALAEVVAGGEASGVAGDAQRRLDALHRLREVDEAMRAGREALASLAEARRSFDSADGWSTWDTLGGGGFVSSLIKHEHMDKAAAHLRDASASVERFSRELADVDLPGLRIAPINEFDRSIDIWFDNIFTDLAVSERIGNARADVERTISAVDDVLRTLDGERQQLARL